MSRESIEERLTFRLGRIQHSQALIQGCVNTLGPGAEPSEKDLAAITWWLGGIYNEIEEVMKGIAEEFGERLPSSSRWHRDLIEQMAASSDRRAAVLTPGLRERLDPLRAFRHFSRNATALDPDWQRMQPLVADLAVTVREFERDRREFLARL